MSERSTRDALELAGSCILIALVLLFALFA